jgi:signal transduction histidine kinase
MPELVGGRAQLPGLWGRRGFWQTKLRWAVAPLMVAGLLLGHALGFELPVVPILLIALASPIYNAFFAWIFSRYRTRLEQDPRLDRLYTILEILADYAAMFLLIYFTGGVSSPLVVFLIFHVIIAAIQFSPGTGFLFAGLAASGLWLLLLAQVQGWCACDLVKYRGLSISLMDRPVYAAVLLLFFTATLFLTAAIVSKIMRRLRERVGDLGHVTAELAHANEKLRSLYKMVTAIGAQHRLEPVLATVTAELAKATDASAVAVKLLSDDARSLRYVAAWGLPGELITDKVVYLEQSPLNRRIIEGETLVEANLDEGDTFQLHRELTDLGIRSAIQAPLEVAGRVIGTLGFYSRTAGRFRDDDAPFLKLAAELVAIAIDDARAFDAIEDLMNERTQFMLEVAHNLRAPLGASLGILDLLNDGYLGRLSEQQEEHLKRLDARLRSLDQTVSELLALARNRDRSREIPDVVIDLVTLAGHTERTFREDATKRGLDLRITTDENLPHIESGLNLLEQVMENLVSNAIKYTPEGGSVYVDFSRPEKDRVRIVVRDTGIGIPADEQEKLFRSFFRASNAKKVTTNGTGLGLTLVKQTVERHNGQISVTSEEGQGTTVVVDLPLRQTLRSQSRLDSSTGTADPDAS